MLKRSFDFARITDRLQAEAIRRRHPLSCTLELTYRCNFRCRMCYIRMTDGQAAAHGRLRTADEWLDMGRQLLRAGVLYLSLSGGECTLFPGFDRLYTGLARMGFRISVMSNAAAYDDDLRDLFRRYPPAEAAVTLYGGCNRTYGAVTGDYEGFDRAMEGIRFFRSIGVPVLINFTMVRQNALDYPLVSRVGGELGLSYTLITDITDHRFGPALSQARECRLNAAQRALIGRCKPDEVGNALEKADSLMERLEGFTPPAADVKASAQQDLCIGGCSGCAIGWNGDMQTCVSLLGYKPVKPFQTGFDAAWAQLRQRESETFLLPEACANCTMTAFCRHNCAGRRFEGTGSPLGPDSEQCRYAYLLNVLNTDDPEAPERPTPDCL